MMWVGGEGGMEAGLVQRAGIAFKSIPAAGVHGVGLKSLPRNVGLLLRGVFASRRILREFKPEALMFTGGYVAVPLAVAGRAVPSLLYVPDIEPGLALKTIARLADVITVTAEDSQKFFNKKTRILVTGYPTRAELMKWDRPSGRSALNLRDDLPALLVFGGSKGARSINTALLGILPALLAKAQVVHLSGELDWPVVEARRRELSGEQAERYHAYPYLHEQMGAALAAADLAVSRAGASALGEFPLFGLPAVLVPYPHAWRYQKVNAEHLARNGGALVLDDTRLKDGLLPTVSALLDDPARLNAMRSAMRAMARPDAAERIAAELVKLAEKGRSPS
jgi:undecaprenyldiphospho-muramoylpentapeptide beta-N-acetylglucosaminyltransferase